MQVVSEFLLEQEVGSGICFSEIQSISNIRRDKSYSYPVPFDKLSVSSH